MYQLNIFQVRLYLDSKPQVVNIAGKPHIFRFAKGLKFVVINGHPFTTDFGGHAMTVYVNNIEHFLRLTALPPGVRPGEVRLWNMEGSDLKSGSPPSRPSPRKPKRQQPAPDISNETKKPESDQTPSLPADQDLSPVSSPEPERASKAIELICTYLNHNYLIAMPAGKTY